MWSSAGFFHLTQLISGNMRWVVFVVYRAIKAQEARVMQISNQKAAITEEKKVVVAMRNEVIALREQTKAERLKMEDEVRLVEMQPI